MIKKAAIFLIPLLEFLFGGCNSSKSPNVKTFFKDINSFTLEGIQNTKDTSKAIIDLDYCINNNDTVLINALFFDGMRETIYYPENNEKVEPDISVVESEKNKSKLIISMEWDDSNDKKLVFYKKIIDNQKKIISEEKECYLAIYHSYFWWRFFGWSAKKIDCDKVSPQ
jgi:hypothetical protein